MSRPVVRLSVRAVVETTHHDSDLSPAAGAAQRMREGAIAHRARQSAGHGLDDTYQHEVALSADYEGEALLLHVAGRADAIFMRDGMHVIEEIKLGTQDVPLVPAHMAQAAMYGHMLCRRNALAGVCLRVVYVDLQGNVIACYEQERAAEALAAEFDALCAPAADWEARKLGRREKRDASLEALAFPFEAYRSGQRRFAANVYVALKEKKRLFAQAPTGIGKTMAALYPALKAIGEGKCARAFFLTARNTGRRSAMDAMARLTQAGAGALAVEIAAKDKTCLMEKRDCRPESCPYARGFYDRLPAALEEALGAALLGREEIAALAKAHAVCPFELSLEAARLADVIVCDYNYIFDPFVSIDELLHGAGGACLLVDEAHQLAPRVRDAYSALLDMDTLRTLRRDAGKAYGRKCALYRALTGAIRSLEGEAEKPEFEQMDSPPEALSAAMHAVQGAAGEQLSRSGGSCAADSFALAAGYLLAAERFDERYALLARGGRKEARMELALLTAEKEILAATKRARGTVYFSATLAPFEAAKKMLGSEAGDACLLLPSPFDPAQLSASIAPIDLRYASRERTAPDAAEAIAAHIRRHEGNTIVFFPSYAYMNRIAELLMGMEGMLNVPLMRERRGMTEDEKNALLGAFDGEERIVLLAVLGGAFSEGVDLPGDRLKNVIVVSTGMPQPDEKLRAMQAYYDSIGENGFDLCMTIPGMIRVIQAAGRLIRMETDTGTLLLLDSRYRYPRVRALLSGTLIGDALDMNRQN